MSWSAYMKSTAVVPGSTDALSGMITGTIAVAVLRTSDAGRVGFLTRPLAVSCHCHFQLGLLGTLTSVPDQVDDELPEAVALAMVVPVAYVPATPPVQPVKVVAEIPVQVTAPEEPTEIVFEPALYPVVLATVIVAAGSVTGAVRVVVSRRSGLPG